MIVSFSEFNKKEKELKEYKKSICKLIDQYINLNYNLNNKTKFFSERSGKTYDFYDEELRNLGFAIEFHYGNFYNLSDTIYLKNNEYNDLIKFMEDPEQYKLEFKSKKYNL